MVLEGGSDILCTSTSNNHQNRKHSLRLFPNVLFQQSLDVTASLRNVQPRILQKTMPTWLECHNLQKSIERYQKEIVVALQD